MLPPRAKDDNRARETDRQKDRVRQSDRKEEKDKDSVRDTAQREGEKGRERAHFQPLIERGLVIPDSW